MSLALADANFLKAFAGAVAKASEKSPESLGARQRLALTRWSCLVLGALDAREHAAAFAKIARALGGLIATRVVVAGRGRRDGACGAFQQLARREPGHLRAIVELLGDGGAKAATTSEALASASLAAEAWTAAATAPPGSAAAEALPAARAVAMETYLAVVFSSDAKLKMPARASDVFRGFARTFTADELRDAVLPKAVKQLRRNPEGALAATRALLETTECDLREHVDALADVLTPQAKHADEWRRVAAGGCLAAVARGGGGACVRAIFNRVKPELMDTAKRPKEWHARAGLFDVLASLADGAGGGGGGGAGKAIASVAADACETLAAATKTEAQKDAKERAIHALGAWLAHFPGPLPGDVVDLAATLMKDAKDLHHRAIMRALSSALASNPGLAEGAGGLVKHLAPLTTSGAGKLSQRVDGALALHVVAAAAAADAGADAEAMKLGVWSDAIKPDSTFFTPGAVSKLGFEDSEVLARGLGALLTSHGERLRKAKSATEATRTLALLFLHPTISVRVAAKAGARAATRAGVAPLDFVLAMRHWLAAADVPGGWPALSPNEGEGESSSSAPAGKCGEFPARLAGAALGTLCAGDDFPSVPPGLLGHVLLLAHHPRVAAPDGRRVGAWEALLAKLSAAAEAADEDDPRMTLRDDVEGACVVIAGELGLKSSLASDRDAAVRAAFAAARLNPAVALDALLPAAEALADVEEHASLTPEAIKIYNCQVGRLSTDQVDVFKPEVRADANAGAKKARGKSSSRTAYGSDSDDDAPAAVSLRPSQAQVAAKGGRGGAGGRGAGKEMDKKELARRAQFAEEAAVRATVRDLAERLTLRLRLTSSLMRGGTRRGAAAERVPEITSHILPLLASEVLPEDVVRDVAASLVIAAAGVPGNAAMALGFAGVPETFAAALRLSAPAADGTSPPPEVDARGDPIAPSSARVAAETAALAAALDAAAEAVEMNDLEPLPPAALALLFPVCARALLLPDAAPAAIRTAALDVLTPHAQPGVPGLPRAAAARLMLTVIATGAPPQVAAARPLLMHVALGADEENDGGAAVTTALRAGLSFEFRAVRAAALAALLAAPPVLDPAAPEGTTLLFLARHDPDEDNRATAEDVWKAYGLDDAVAETIPPATILPYLSHDAAAVRDAAVGAFAESVAALDSGVAPVLAKLFAAFSACSPRQEDKDDGDDPFAAMERKKAASFPGEENKDLGKPYGRAAIARALGAVAPSLTARDLPLVTTFLTKVLGDQDELVRDAAMTGGRAMIDLHGAEHVQQLLGVYEGYFDRGAAAGSGLSESQNDFVRQGVVVFLGALACHLPREDPKIRQILSRLVAVLSTPSEAVQRAVADCLPPLMPSLEDDERRTLIESLLTQVTSGEGYADRRGAAFGLAGAVKGVGISSLKSMGVMDAIKAAVEDKKNPDAREGALMAFELLNVRLGRLFEPYVIHVLPMLLVCFGDQSANVREATISAARAVMGQLSAQGVKLVLPALMKGLEDKAWRTKEGSVQLLGAMSACAPKQLSACLPQIVPRLSETLIDTHPKVVDAASRALKQIGDVIRNPEIQALSNYLLGAIAKPAELTQPCLDVLLEMTFVNVVDAPSLALIVPVLSRGLRDRRADLKKKAAKIAGNMCALVSDAKDMNPYVPILLPDIQKSLLDPIPEVRATAAAALASLVKGMGGVEEHFSELMPWLTETLQSDGPPTERSGAAQGLAECLAVLGAEYFEAILPEILAGCHHAAPHVREGHLTLLRFLPLALGRTFEAHLKEALAEVLGGLADPDEPVRDAALGAGRVFVEEFSHSGPSLDLLLPSIEDGIAAENWRIRQSAVELLGSMMFRIAGTSGKVRVEGGSDDEGVSTEAQGKALTSTLGVTRHHDLLAAVYSLRSDPMLVVRQAALHIWKTVVANTPRTLRLILPRLMQRLIAGLSAHNDDRRTTASRCLGELVRKLGERVLPEVFPILRAGLESEDKDTREGVCLGLAEVLGAARKEQLEEYYAEVVPVIRDALCDAEDAVRNAAGSAFDAMFRHGGADTASDIVPALLAKLDTDPVALEGLKQVLRAQPKILASVLPKLASPPINAARARTLGSLAEVAGAALPPHLPLLFPPLLAAMGSDSNEDEADAAYAAASAVLRAVPIDAHYLLLPEVLGGLSDETASTRAAAAKLCGAFASEAPCFDEDDDVPQLITALFELFVDVDEAVVLSAWTALGVIMAKVAKEDQAHYLRDVCQAVDTAREKVRRRDRGASEILIPALCLPKGLAPIVQVYLQGVLTGRHAEDKEQAAEGLRAAVLSTTTAAIKPHVIPITGPLIRILGDKYPGSVKSAILGALAVMIEKGGLALKPFVPQLQTTFVKCLSDGNRAVRQKAAAALGRLMVLQPRVDPLLSDLLTALSTNPDRGVREATLRAIAGVFAHAGKNVGAANVATARSAVFESLLCAVDDGSRGAAALALAHAAAWLPDDDRGVLVEELGSGDGDADEREGRALALSAIARTSPELVLASHAAPALNGLVKAGKDESTASRIAAARGLTRLAIASAAQVGSNCPYLPKLLPVLSRLLRDDQQDVREATTTTLKRLAKEHPDALSPHLGAFVPALADVAAGDRSKEARYYADRALRHALQIYDTPDGLLVAQGALKAGGDAHAARGKLTDIVLRRLKALPDESDDEGEQSGGNWGSLGADADDDDVVVLGD